MRVKILCFGHLVVMAGGRILVRGSNLGPGVESRSGGSNLGPGRVKNHPPGGVILAIRFWSDFSDF